jgi:hypothetical protein
MSGTPEDRFPLPAMLHRVRISPDRWIIVQASDVQGAVLGALQWSRDNGVDLWINSAREAVTEYACVVPLPPPRARLR